MDICGKSSLTDHLRAMFWMQNNKSINRKKSTECLLFIDFFFKFHFTHYFSVASLHRKQNSDADVRLTNMCNVNMYTRIHNILVYKMSENVCNYFSS